MFKKSLIILLLIGLLLISIYFITKNYLSDSVISSTTGYGLIQGDNGISSGIILSESVYIGTLIKKTCPFGKVYASYTIQPPIPINIINEDIFYSESNVIYTNISRGCSINKKYLQDTNGVLDNYVDQSVENRKYIRYDEVESGSIVKTTRYILHK